MNPISNATLLKMTESETFDFKSGQYKFYDATDEEKSELLKDIMAFANAWKSGEAFIVIGVSEKNGRKDAVVGVTSPLRDNDIQQFINSKTNRPVRFLVYSDNAENQDINVIQIARDQQRPIFLTKKFGNLKPNDVHVRSGSSTAIASPDQIAEMAKADQQIIASQANLDFEWADSYEDRRLGKDITVKCVKLIDPPPRPPKKALSPPDSDLPSSISERVDSMMKSNYALNAAPLFSRPSFSHEPSVDEVVKYTKELALLKPLRVCIGSPPKKTVSFGEGCWGGATAPPRPEAERRCGQVRRLGWACPQFGASLPTERRTNDGSIPARNISQTLACVRKASGTAMHTQLPASPTPRTIRPAARARLTQKPP